MGPIPGSVISRRVRPCVSRANVPRRGPLDLVAVGQCLRRLRRERRAERRAGHRLSADARFESHEAELVEAIGLGPMCPCPGGGGGAAGIALRQRHTTRKQDCYCRYKAHPHRTCFRSSSCIFLLSSSCHSNSKARCHSTSSARYRETQSFVAGETRRIACGVPSALTINSAGIASVPTAPDTGKPSEARAERGITTRTTAPPSSEVASSA